MKYIRNIFLISCILIFPLFANYSSNAVINWKKGFIFSTGRASVHIQDNGLPVDNKTGSNTSINKARRDTYSQAREKAVENLVSVMKTIRVEPDKTLNDLLIENVITQEILSKNLLNWLKYKEYPENFYTALCEVKLNFGVLITALPINYPSNKFPVRDDIPLSTYYSSLIVDSRGLEVEPMLLPSIYSEDGLEIYGKQFIESSSIMEGGMISYCNTEEEAMKSKRAGERPYFTIALKSIRGCPVISEKDTRRILSNKMTIKNLKNSRVVFIIDGAE